VHPNSFIDPIRTSVEQVLARSAAPHTPAQSAAVAQPKG
jgi:hypothetical protein